MNAFRSSVRPIVTLVLTSAFVYGFFLGKISQDAFVPVVGMVVSWWFASRETGRDRRDA